MKRKISFLVLALGLTIAAVWSPAAEALPPYCETICSGVNQFGNCVCAGTRVSTTCDRWILACP